jgi:hypothetical protein
MVEVFKTDVADASQSQLLEYVLSSEFSDYKVNFDLSDCDKILRIESNKINVNKVLSIVNRLGYQCHVLA